VKLHPKLAPLLPNSYRAYSLRGGKLFLRLRESPQMLARALGIYECDKTEAIISLLRPGMTFVDVGVNKGDFSILGSTLVGQSGKVLCFEPEPENCYWIRRSIELNGYTNISLFELALSDVNGDAQLYLGRKSGWHTLIPCQAGCDAGIIMVRRRTLDDFLEDICQDRVDMIKIDVEGAELQVLRGAARTLSRNKEIVLLIDVHPRLGVAAKEVCDFLNEDGFTIYQMRKPFDLPVDSFTDLVELLAYRANRTQAQIPRAENSMAANGATINSSLTVRKNN